MMIRRVHIVGASGSGTTTLGENLGKALNWRHFDTDNYFWLATEPPYLKQTLVPERLAAMDRDLSKYETWVLSGSLCGWGDGLIPYFDLVIFLYIPGQLRLDRLAKREFERYGPKIKVGGDRHQQHLEFIEWASKYDEGGMEVRSKVKHEEWLNQLTCPVLRIEGDVTVDEKLKLVKQWISEFDG